MLLGLKTQLMEKSSRPADKTKPAVQFTMENLIHIDAVSDGSSTQMQDRGNIDIVV